jgi:hypothetical protein
VPLFHLKAPSIKYTVEGARLGPTTWPVPSLSKASACWISRASWRVPTAPCVSFPDATERLWSVLLVYCAGHFHHNHRSHLQYEPTTRKDLLNLSLTHDQCLETTGRM